MAEPGFHLTPEFHESYIGHFDIMTDRNFSRVAKNAGLEGFQVQFNLETGRAETIKINGENVRIEELKKGGRFYDELRNRMSPEERVKFDAQVKDAANKKVYKTPAEIDAARKVSESTKNVEKVKELYPGLDTPGSQGQSKFTDALAKLALDVGKYGFLAGVTALGLYELGEANKGCYLVNAETNEYVSDRLSGSTDRAQCSCATFADDCNAYCGKQPDAAQMLRPGSTIDTVFYDPGTCAQYCGCMRKGKNGEQPQLQPAGNNAQFTVVEGGVFNTFSRLLGSVGYEVKRFVDDAMDIVDSAAKGISNLFSKWWVILIIVGVGLVIILVPTLVTQLPKAKQKGLAGGTLKRYPLAHYPYY